MASLQCFLIVDSAAWVDKAQQIQTWSYHKTTTFARSHLSLSKLYKNQRKWCVCRNPLNTKVQSSSASAKSRAQLFLGGTQGNIQLRSSNLPWQIRCESRISTLRMRKFVWILTFPHVRIGQQFMCLTYLLWGHRTLQGHLVKYHVISLHANSQHGPGIQHQSIIQLVMSIIHQHGHGGHLKRINQHLAKLGIWPIRIDKLHQGLTSSCVYETALLCLFCAQKDFELLKCLSFTKQPSMANVAEAAAFNFFETTSSEAFLSATLLVERSKRSYCRCNSTYVYIVCIYKNK